MLSIFRMHKRYQEAAPQPVDPVVDRARKKTHDAADAAKKQADRLNSVFTENGITLAILKAAGGGHGQ